MRGKSNDKVAPSRKAPSKSPMRDKSPI